MGATALSLVEFHTNGGSSHSMSQSDDRNSSAQLRRTIESLAITRFRPTYDPTMQTAHLINAIIAYPKKTSNKPLGAPTVSAWSSAGLELNEVKDHFRQARQAWRRCFVGITATSVDIGLGAILDIDLTSPVFRTKCLSEAVYARLSLCVAAKEVYAEQSGALRKQR